MAALRERIWYRPGGSSESQVTSEVCTNRLVALQRQSAIPKTTDAVMPWKMDCRTLPDSVNNDIGLGVHVDLLTLSSLLLQRGIKSVDPPHLLPFCAVKGMAFVGPTTYIRQQHPALACYSFDS
jgi:hypothetical protein